MKKAQRAEEAKPKKIHQLRANFYEGGSCQLVGLPIDLRTAMSMAATINLAIAAHFVQAARDGKVSGDGKIEESQIIVPDASVLVPGLKGG